MATTIERNRTIWIDTKPKNEDIIKEISAVVETPAGIVDKLHLLIKPYNKGGVSSKEAYIEVTKLIGRHCHAERTMIEINKRPS